MQTNTGAHLANLRDVYGILVCEALLASVRKFPLPNTGILRARQGVEGSRENAQGIQPPLYMAARPVAVDGEFSLEYITTWTNTARQPLVFEILVFPRD